MREHYDDLRLTHPVPFGIVQLLLLTMLLLNFLGGLWCVERTLVLARTLHNTVVIHA